MQTNNSNIGRYGINIVCRLIRKYISIAHLTCSMHVFQSRLFSASVSLLHPPPTALLHISYRTTEHSWPANHQCSLTCNKHTLTTTASSSTKPYGLWTYTNGTPGILCLVQDMMQLLNSQWNCYHSRRLLRSVETRTVWAAHGDCDNVRSWFTLVFI